MLLTSFTEQDRQIDFDPKTHTYIDLVSGERLISSTNFIKRFKEDFDSETVAKKCSRDYKWGVEPSAILKLWSNNGVVTSAFGDAAHEAMEHWERFKKLGEKIVQSKGKGPNPALPKHPLIKGVIESFMEVDPYGSEEGWVVLPEVFVSYGKYCGLIDRLSVNRTKKQVRLGDYKFNIKAETKGQVTFKEPFKHLPSTKVSGYSLQLSFYARLLELAGWEVLSLDGFVYEEGWKRYLLDYLTEFREFIK